MKINKVYTISIIVPVFNVEPFIHKCVDSILAQTYTNFELILVDDGSTDGSGKICDEYSKKDARINVIHKQNGGQSTARNAGINAAKGNYLSFVDADDYIEPIMIETLFNLAVQYDADISECGYISIFKDKEIICNFGNGIEYGEGNFLVEKFIDSDIFYGVVTKLFRASLFNRIKFPCGRIYEDTWITLNFCLDQLRYVRTQKPLYYYYQREYSTLRSEITKRKAREFIYILESQLELINHKVTDNNLKGRLNQRIMEKSVSWYLSLALSDQKVIRHIYSRLYLKRMNYSVIECLKSINIPLKIKLLFILCKGGLREGVLLIKSLSLSI
jgi:glycosyltransferase involved in cell wall biosynthesis